MAHPNNCHDITNTPRPARAAKRLRSASGSGARQIPASYRERGRQSWKERDAGEM